MTFRENMAENVCAMQPLWRALLGVEVVFLVLAVGAAAIGAGGRSGMTLLVLNLGVIVPTTAALVVTLRWCARQEAEERDLGRTRQ